MLRRLIAEGLTCRRGGRLLFQDLSFVLAPGEALIVLGPNGAGKSSLLRILAGFLEPEAGETYLEGEEDIFEPFEAAHCLGHRDGVKAALTVREAAFVERAILGGEVDAVDPALERVGLGRFADVPCGALSAGQRRRVGMARLLTCPRPLWLLDEPTTALDTTGRVLMEALIAEHRSGGGMVVAATHQAIEAPKARRLRLDRREIA